MGQIQSRRAFIGRALFYTASLSLGICSLKDVPGAIAGEASGAGSISILRLDPEGGGDYRNVQMGDPSLTHPLDENVDGFEPFALGEEGGTRIVTPFFSVFIPDGMFADGFSISYSSTTPSDKIWGSGLLRGYDLSVHPSSGEPDIHAYVATANWNGAQGEYVACSTGPVASDPAFHVIVDGFADYSSDPLGEQARRQLYPTYALVSPYIVAARASDGSWEVVEVTQDLPHVSETNGTAELATPWYTVRINQDLWPNGLLYRYFGETVPIEQRDGTTVETLGVQSGFLALFDPEGPELVCLLYTYDGIGSDGLSTSSFFVTREIGMAADGSEKSVHIAVPIYGVTRDNYASIDEFQRSSMETIESLMPTVEL